MDFSAAYTVKLNKNTLSQYICTVKSKPIFNIPSYSHASDKDTSKSYLQQCLSIDNWFEVTIIFACG